MKENIFDKENDLVTAFSDEKIKKLGIKTFTQFECLKSILDLYINFYTNENIINQLNQSLNNLIESKIFEKMIKIYFDYPMNNLYQNLFNQIIQIAINSKSPNFLIDSIFKINEDPKENLIYLIIENIVKETEFQFKESKNKMRSILLASNTNILKNIFSSENNYLKSIYENDEPIKLFSLNFVPSVSEQFEKKLMQETKEADFQKAEFLNPIYDTQEKEENIPFSVRSLSDLVFAQIEIYKSFLKGGNEYLELIKKEEEILKKNNKNDKKIIDEKNDSKINEFDSEENLYAYDYNQEINLDLNEHINEYDNKKENEKYFDNNYWNPHNLMDNEEFDQLLQDL